MPRVKLLNMGSRRRISQIRWTRWDVLHAIALFLLMAGISVWIAVWFNLYPTE